MKYKVTFLILIISFSFNFLTGCWNYREINDFRIVTGVAIDYDKTNKEYILTVEVIKTIADENEEKMTGETFVSNGATIFDAIRNTITESGKRLYWSNATVVIVSEEIAKRGIVPVLDMISRDPEMRSELLLLISKEDTAREILTSKSIAPQRVVSYSLETTLENEESSSNFHRVAAWMFIKDLYSEVNSPTCPGVKLGIYDETQTIEGTTVFKGDKLVGWLDKNETKYFLWITNKLKGGVYNLDISHKENLNIKELNLEIFHNKTKQKLKLKDENIVIYLDINTSGNIGEFSGNIDISDPDEKSKIENIIEKQIQRDIELLIKKLQLGYQSDILGFRSIVKKEIPDMWKSEIKENWEKYYSELEVNVTVDFKIRGSSNSSKPIIIRD
ncbi:Ger(x)C family spore germination protein [Sporosalibacterium faouarense]|uniref:Ger(x)C family spore germination protein n=1 Tax=Sporosalibacterium faouarense TaxID=516123 RepID=UPI00141C81F5|nr:Ger(x)C family spore germination protein [Sporosalibacterium faouarense]MTI46345.1 Ger(x)C family spore germination protein [Bacillota bacterium]